MICQICTPQQFSMVQGNKITRAETDMLCTNKKRKLNKCLHCVQIAIHCGPNAWAVIGFYLSFRKRGTGMT